DRLRGLRLDDDARAEEQPFLPPARGAAPQGALPAVRERGGELHDPGGRPDQGGEPRAEARRHRRRPREIHAAPPRGTRHQGGPPPMEASVETLFVQHAGLLALPCHVIFTFPLWLRFRAAELGALYDGQPAVLPMVKIASQDGALYPAGVQKLYDLVGRRLKD